MVEKKLKFIKKTRGFSTPLMSSSCVIENMSSQAALVLLLLLLLHSNIEFLLKYVNIFNISMLSNEEI